MDDKTFDEMSRGLISSEPRRNILKALGGGVLGAGLSFIGIRRDGAAAQDVDAERRRRRRRKNGQTGCRSHAVCATGNPCFVGFCRVRGNHGTCVQEYAPNGTPCGGQNQQYPDVCSNGVCVADS